MVEDKKDIKYFWKNDNYGCQERFNLLLLEPGEVYFEDFSVYYYPSQLKEDMMKKRQKGRLKICSKSLVFDPLDHTFPILKFLFKDMIDIGKKAGLVAFSNIEQGGAEIIQIESKVLCLCGYRRYYFTFSGLILNQLRLFCFINEGFSDINFVSPSVHVQIVFSFFKK